VPSIDITFCQRENNQCKKRLKCFRYTYVPKPEDLTWYGDYWNNFGKECKEFIEDKNHTRQEVYGMDQDATVHNMPKEYSF
jgi:hypothetical protein